MRVLSDLRIISRASRVLGSGSAGATEAVSMVAGGAMGTTGGGAGAEQDEVLAMNSVAARWATRRTNLDLTPRC